MEQIDRRELLERAAALLGVAVTSSAAAGVLSGCAAFPGGSGPPRFFTPQEAKTVAVMAEHIIPRTDTPGAIDAGVPAFIDRMLADFYTDRERTLMREGLAKVEADARAAHGKAFPELTAEQQVAMLKAYDQEAYRTPGGRHFFRTMKELTTLGFFTSRPGATRVLNYDQTPGPYRGDVPLSEIGRQSAL